MTTRTVPYPLVRAAARAAKPAVRRMWRRTVLRRATDETASAAVRSAVVVAPHPDDETLGCGALIARKRAAGADVDVVIVTDGRHSHRSALISPDELAEIRAREGRAACDRLGVDARRVHLLGYHEADLDAHFEPLVERLGHLIETARPDDVFTTCGADWHVDHQAVNKATQRAVQERSLPCRLLEYPIWWWVDGPWVEHGRAEPRRAWQFLSELVQGSLVEAVKVETGPFRDAKRGALREYRSQTTRLTGEATWAIMDDNLLALFLGTSEPFLVPQTSVEHGAP